MQMSSLQHGEGCDCAAVKSCPGCQSWIIPRKGKASISRRGGGGEGTSLWQDTQTWPALPLIRGIMEDTLHLKWMVLCDFSKRSRLNLLNIRQTHYVWLIMIFTLGWLLQGCEGTLSVCSFCYLTILGWCFLKFVCFFLFGNFYILSWSEVTLLTWPLSGDPPVTVPHDDLPTLPFSNEIVLHQVYSSKILHDCPSLGRETIIMRYCTSPASRVLAQLLTIPHQLASPGVFQLSSRSFTSDNTVKHWETLWFIVAIVQKPPPVPSPPPWLGLPSGPALICTTSL